MSEHLGIRGNWEGEYHYDADEKIKVELLPQKFSISVEKTKGDRFWGKVEEKEGMPGIGKIEGVSNGQSLSFIKKMPKTYAFDEKNKLIRLQGKHPKIYYEGRWDKSGTVITGTWKMKFAIRFHGIFPIPLVPLTGTWQMVRRR